MTAIAEYAILRLAVAFFGIQVTLENMTSPASPYGKRASSAVTTRLTHKQLSEVKRAAAAHSLTVGAFTRHVLTKLATGSPDPSGLVDDLKAALGLDPSADEAAILEAVNKLIDADADPEDGVHGGPAAPDPLAAAPDQHFPPSSDEAAAEGDKADRGVQKFIREQRSANEANAARRAARASRSPMRVNVEATDQILRRKR